jgi:hypothetical protein
VVIASVSTPQAVDQLEKKSKGSVKALVLNPKEVRDAKICLQDWAILTPLSSQRLSRISTGP